MKLSTAALAAGYVSEDKAIELLERVRWPDGPCCPKCGRPIWRMKDARSSSQHLWRCSHAPCSHQTSWRRGTAFANIQTSPQVIVWGLLKLREGFSAKDLVRKLKDEQEVGRTGAHRLLLSLLELAVSGARDEVSEASREIRALRADLRSMTRQARVRRASLAVPLITATLLGAWGTAPPPVQVSESATEMKAVWRSGGDKQIVTCGRMEGESRVDWAARFMILVEESKAELPPD